MALAVLFAAGIGTVLRFWTLLLGDVAVTLLLGGGLEALQNGITTLGLPFCGLLIFIAVALTRALVAGDLGDSLEDVAVGRVRSNEPIDSA